MRPFCGEESQRNAIRRTEAVSGPTAPTTLNVGFRRYYYDGLLSILWGSVMSVNPITIRRRDFMARLSPEHIVYGPESKIFKNFKF